MTQPLQALLAAHPRAVQCIQIWDDDTLLSGYDDEDAVNTIRNFCSQEGVGRPLLDSIETLLGLIESKAAAEAPLSDAEIEGMKWTRGECSVGPVGLVTFHAYNGENAANAVESHNSDIDRCHREIKRLRGGGK